MGQQIKMQRGQKKRDNKNAAKPRVKENCHGATNKTNPQWNKI